MEKFTASEVRKSALAVVARDMEYEAEMLQAYADLLEAQEMAVPVMVVNHVSSAEHDLPIGMKLYTHPSPADAERLAEALREIADFDCGCVPCTGECRKGRAAEIELQARMEIAQKALAAHSAQAQPPAASATDAAKIVVDREGVHFGKHFWASHESITGQTADSLRKRRGIGAGYMEWLDAQATSVADGRCTWVEDDDGNWETGCGNMFVLTDGTPYDNEMGFCCYCGHKLDQITQETAAQENPNG